MTGTKAEDAGEGIGTLATGVEAGAWVIGTKVGAAGALATGTAGSVEGESLADASEALGTLKGGTKCRRLGK